MRRDFGEFQDRVLTQLAGMQALLIDNRAASCPHRDTLTRAANNLARFDKIEGRIVKVESEVQRASTPAKATARTGAVSGGTVAAVLIGFAELAKHLGWWSP